MAQSVDKYENGFNLSSKDVTVLRRQLEAQSEFCSMIGSLLGHLLWDLSKCPHIANVLSRKDRIDELLEVIRSAIMCYARACSRSRDVWPGGLSSDETRLAVSMAGFAANLAAVSPAVLIKSGKQFIKDIATILPTLTADPLTKVLFELLYNVSLDEVGASILQERVVILAINKAIRSRPEIRLSALKLLASLTLRQVPPVLLNLLPLEQVRTLYHTGDAEMAFYADMILRRITPLME